jgi:hypothetical protein
MNVWKVLGLAGLAGVTAAGVIIAREQRQRTQLAPDEIRARLHERLEQVPSAPTGRVAPNASVSTTTRRRWFPRQLRGRAKLRLSEVVGSHRQQPRQ